jgi:hypothetical protein
MSTIFFTDFHQEFSKVLATRALLPGLAALASILQNCDSTGNENVKARALTVLMAAFQRQRDTISAYVIVVESL